MPMTQKAELTAIGLMSGTSLDGIDAAILKTDGRTISEFGPTRYESFSAAHRKRLRSLLEKAVEEGRRQVLSTSEYAELCRDFTLTNVRAIELMLRENEMNARDIDLIGFHGQTVLHHPELGWTWQMGDGDLLAHETGIAVIDDFRGADVAAGGQGAPFAPLYHQALVQEIGLDADQWPIGILNIGGITNLTWISADGDLIGFDTGTGNGLLNEWVFQHTGEPFDRDGLLASRGKVDRGILENAMSDAYFDLPFPKSLDRNSFTLDMVSDLTLEDGAATLAAFTVAGIALAVNQVPTPPAHIYVCGGGRKNIHIMNMLRDNIDVIYELVDALNWRGDFVEAECFAFLAVRSHFGYPLSVPGTTGVASPTVGGVYHSP